MTEEPAVAAAQFNVLAAAFDHYHPGSPDQLTPHEPRDCPVMKRALAALIAAVRTSEHA